MSDAMPHGAGLVPCPLPAPVAGTEAGPEAPPAALPDPGRGLPYPRVMVVAGFPPEGGGGGGVILRSMLEVYPADRLLWCALLPDITQKQTWWRPEIPRHACPFYLRGRRFPVLRELWRWCGRHWETRVAARSAAAAADRFQPDVVWAILDYPMIFPIEAFLRRSQLPAHVSVHDDPVIAARLCGCPLPAEPLGRAFARCFARARSRDCISQRLSGYYRQHLGVDSFVLTRGLSRTGVPDPRLSRDMASGIRIVMGGDAAEVPSPWPGNLIRALNLLARDHDQPVEFHAFSTRFNTAEPWVQVHPRLPEPAFDRFLSTMHIGYACDPLSDLGAAFAATSFPTKIVTYIGAGLPFLYHGPRDSTVGDFLGAYRAGVVVEGQDPAQIADGFRNIVANYPAMREECGRAARECFDTAVLRGRLMDALRAAAEPEPDPQRRALENDARGETALADHARRSPR